MKICGRNAFTLIELLVVMAIILILAGLVLAAAGNIRQKGARSRAEGEIAALGAALENFKNDNGDYPYNTNITSNSLLVAALMPSGGSKVYHEFRRKSLDSGNNYLDPWGYVYCYQYPGNSNRNGTSFFDLWSSAGQSANSNTWIKNW
jgi:general secretion pathway protein G